MRCFDGFFMAIVSPIQETGSSHFSETLVIHSKLNHDHKRRRAGFVGHNPLPWSFKEAHAVD